MANFSETAPSENESTYKKRGQEEIEGLESKNATYREPEREKFDGLASVKFPLPTTQFIGGFSYLISLVRAFLKRWGVTDNDTPTPGLEAFLTADAPVGHPEHAGKTLSALSRKLSGFLLNPNTGAPFTVAMTGDWGKGKSSAMTLLQRELDASGYPTVWFNAWHHQKEEHLFAALIEEVRRAAMPGFASWRSLNLSSIAARLRLIGIRLRARPFRFALLVFILVSAVGLITGLWHSDQIAALQFSKLPAFGAGFVALFAVHRIVTTFKPFQASAASLLLEAKRGITAKRFQDKLSFRDSFAAAFSEVTEALGRKRLTIFIDDLDRCDINQVVDLMEAINFLTSSGRCYVVLGIHEEPVRHALGLNKAALARAHAIAEADRDAVDFANKDDELGMQKERDRYAELYLEKLLNLRVKVPDFDGEALANFISNRVIHEPGEKTAPLAASVCRKRNRRHLFLNVATLLIVGILGWFLSSSHTSTTKVESMLVAAFNPMDISQDNGKADLSGATSPTGANTADNSQNSTNLAEGQLPIFTVLTTIPIAYLLLHLVLKRRRKTTEAEARAKGQRDSRAFEEEVRDSLYIFQIKPVLPRTLNRFVNLARYLTAGLNPDNRSDAIRWFVRLSAMVETSGGAICASNLELKHVKAWIDEMRLAENLSTQIFTEGGPVNEELLEEFKQEAATIKFVNELDKITK